MQKERPVTMRNCKSGLMRLALMTACAAGLMNGYASAQTYKYNLAASSLGTGHYRVDILIAGQAVGHAEFSLR
jgi:hypothetical protein